VVASTDPSLSKQHVLSRTTTSPSKVDEDRVVQVHRIALPSSAGGDRLGRGPASERSSAAFSVAKQCNIVVGELWAVEFLTERSGAGLIDIAVHCRIDVISRAQVLNPRTAARAVGHIAGHVQHAPSATRRLSGALRCALFEIVGAADVARIAERVHGLRWWKIPRTPEPARVIGYGMAGTVIL
jgi:hypothetical protein